MLGEETVVGPAQETDVAWAVVSAAAERVSVVELQPDPLGALAALLVHVAAPATTPFMHRSPHRGGDVSRGGSGTGLGERLPRSLRKSEAPRFQAIECLRDGRFDDRGQISVGDTATHEDL